MREKRTKRIGLLGALVVSVTLIVAPTPASAAPVWRIDSASNPTAIPGQPHRYIIKITNDGDELLPVGGVGGNAENCVPGALPPADPSKCYTVKADFPVGITPSEAEALSSPCLIDIPTNSVACSFPGNSAIEQRQPFGASLMIRINTSVAPEVVGKTLTGQLEVSGGGAGLATIVDPVFVSPQLPGFGLASFDGKTTADPAGSPFFQAGGHPYDMTTSFELETYDADDSDPSKNLLWPIEPTKDVVVDLPPGLVGNLRDVDQCTFAQLNAIYGVVNGSECPSSAQVGTTRVRANVVGNVIIGPVPVFNMVPPPDAAARFGFHVVGTSVVLDAHVRRSDYGISIIARNISEGLPYQGGDLTIWGVPTAPSHTSERACPGFQETPSTGGPTCPSGASEIPVLRLPTSCTAPGKGLEWKASVGSWFKPASFLTNGEPDLSDPNWDQASYRTHEAPGYPYPEEEEGVRKWGPERGVEGCDAVPVKSKFEAQPTSIDAETSSGLEVHVKVPNQGLLNKDGIASSDIKKAKVTLPQGVTLNPSQAEGLGVCTPDRYASTELSFFPTPGKGCPDDSKVGTVEVVTPLLDETLGGDVFIAQQDDPTTPTPGAENPFDSLLALYVVIENPERGILVTLAGRVETDEKTGRIVTTFDDLPQQPVTSFDFKFREGARAPLVTPPTCGTYETEAEFTPWSDAAKTLKTSSSFEIVHGIGGGPCPPGGTPGFRPGFTAGTVNNNAGSFSPFNMRLTRSDGEQDLTKFSALLPPGVLAKLAGTAQCPEAAIVAAKGRTGRAELANPSCPLGSQIGRTLAGAGVGSVLTYVPGKIYLAGPYNGAPLSVVAITPAVAGPFDVGTVVVREALDLDPSSAVARVDGAASDPIPHILEGIPLKLRDLRVYVDRPEFTLNATSCDPSAVGATLFGSGADVFSPADDLPVALSARYQAASCASLGFKPRLSLRLSGPTHRGGHPKLTAVVRPRSGDANIGRAAVTLPGTELLENSHIRTICTRVQYAAKTCPPASIYGYARAWSPLLEQPLQGPVYLRSSDHQLPDTVASLDGLVHIDLVGRIDSTRGRLRATFEGVPDAAVSRFVLTMQGGRKGLLVNGADICSGTPRARALFDGQNGKRRDFKPAVKPDCGKARRAKRR